MNKPAKASAVFSFSSSATETLVACISEDDGSSKDIEDPGTRRPQIVIASYFQSMKNNKEESSYARVKQKYFNRGRQCLYLKHLQDSY